MSDSDSDIENKNCDFGSVLAEAREAQNYTVAQVNNHLKIPLHIISAIEASDIAVLPEPAYTQGYIRAYARFLELPEEDVLEIYNRAVPHNTASALKYRSALARDKSSQSPLIKTVSVLMLVAAIAAVFYGGYQYYKDKAGIMEDELDAKEGSFTGNSLDSPGVKPVTIKQNARLTDDDELILQPSDATEITTEEVDDSAITGAEDEPVDEAAPKVETVLQAADTGSRLDTIEFFAEKGSWMEVRDANNKRLFYNMVPEGGARVLQGQAPFSIVMGNAATTKVIINDIAVDLSAYIRPNNTAKFKISSKDKNVVFH